MPLGTLIPSLSTTTFCRALEDHSSTTAPRKLLTVDASRMDHSSHFAAIARFHHLLRGSFPLMLLCSASSPHSGNEYRGIPRSCEQLASRPVRSVVNNLILFNFQKWVSSDYHLPLTRLQLPCWISGSTSSDRPPPFPASQQDRPASRTLLHSLH